MNAPRNTKISIIIVSYDRHAVLCSTLRALNSLGEQAAEIIVVDQRPAAPLPNDVMIIPDLKYVTLPQPGMVKARNHGLFLAKGDIVLFLDDDVVPLPGLLSKHASAYEDPTVGGVAGKILSPDGSSHCREADPRQFDMHIGWEFADFAHDTPGDVMTSRGCNMSFRRELISRLGGFDPNIEIFRDDSDMCFRVRFAGFRIRYVPTAALIHLEAPSGGTRGEAALKSGYWIRELKSYRQHFRHYRDNLYFIFRHFQGKTLRRHLWKAYRDYVGISRWPWRLLAKNVLFVTSIFQAWRMLTIQAKLPRDGFHG